jgi:hypothetical protein
MQLNEGWVGPQALRGGSFVRDFPQASGLSFQRPITDLLFPMPLCLRGNQDGYLAATAQFFTEILAVKGALAKLRIHGENKQSGGGFTAAAISRVLENIRVALRLQKQFLALHFGREIAQRLQLEDGAAYWRLLIALHVLRGGRFQEICEEPQEAVIKHMPSYRMQLLAWMLMALPASVSRRALQCWCGRTKGTAILGRTARSLLRL